jgi:membrane protease YdiL (CAAX protease family)
MAEASADTATEEAADGGLERWLGPHDEQPLFRAAGLDVRMESVAHTLMVLLGALLVPAVLFVAVVSPLEAVGVTEEATPVAFIGVQTALNFVGLALAALGYLFWRQDPSLVGIARPTRRDAGIAVVGFVAFVGLMIALETAVDLLGLELAENVAIEQGQDTPELFLLFIPMQFVFVAPAEELLFRGVVQGLFRRAYGLVFGVAAAGLVFALFHVPALVGATGQVPTLTIILITGCFLGVLYEVTGNLLVPMVVHALWNALTFALQYVDVVNAATLGG